LAALAACGLARAPAAAGPYDAPGRLGRLAGGGGVNLGCRGPGAPTGVFGTGFRGRASGWGLVPPQLSRTHSTLAHDRAGYGFSDPGPLPRDGAAIARDLDRALRAAGEHGPFIVVGHSAGGLYGQLFAARRRRETLGIVLVDSSVPFQDRRPG